MGFQECLVNGKILTPYRFLPLSIEIKSVFKLYYIRAEECYYIWARDFEPIV